MVKKHKNIKINNYIYTPPLIYPPYIRNLYTAQSRARGDFTPKLPLNYPIKGKAPLKTAKNP